MKVVPAILTNNLQEFDDLMARIVVSKKFDRVQVDFIDGEYTNNKTITPSQVNSAFRMDAHLMVVENNLQEYLKYANKFNRVIVQVESVASPENYDSLALDIHSPIEAVEPYLENLKYLNLMAIEPGFGGQELDLKIFENLSYLSNLRNLRHLSFLIGVDGGVEQKHLKRLEELGVDEVVVGAARVLEWK